MTGRSNHIQKNTPANHPILRRLLLLTAALSLLLPCAGCENLSQFYDELSSAVTAEDPAVTVDGSVESSAVTQSGEAGSAIAQSDGAVGQIYTASLTSADIPDFSGNPYAVVNDNIPFFSPEEMTEQSFETYSELDSLGRCGPAYACIGKDIMPTEERGPIGHIKPSGWKFAKYDFIDGKYLYNRCHLIGYQLAAENDNEKNLITGTRYLNVEGMLPFENKIANYVKDTDNHVLFRVTPIYSADELVARGVEMEALSVEDNGAGICFHVFVYNCQPGVAIDYLTGDSWEDGSLPTSQDGASSIAGQGTAVPSPSGSSDESLDPGEDTSSDENQNQGENTSRTYILNTNTMKFHEPSCDAAKKISSYNREEYTGSREDLILEGYTPCGNCRP